jgi:hypothetical protein
MTATEGAALFHRMIAFNHGDEERDRLMRKVWSGTPWMVDAWTDDEWRLREMRLWCRGKFGDEADPFRDHSGSWRSGNATVCGWTWFGFATEAQMQEFGVAWPPKVNP